MATENILIKFTADTSGITKSIDELQKMGKVTEDDAKKLQMLEGIAEGVADALKEAGVDAKNLNKQVTESVNSGKSLRTQFSEAKNEAVKLSKEFGAFSKEAREAAKRAALIKDEIADLNANLDALNPEAKLNAFVNLGQGIQGAFQVATGALQVFGVENERITKLAQQFQGVLNLTQGINSVLQLKDVYTQLRLVLGVTTTAQEGLKAATIATAVAEEGAAVATNTLNASLKALIVTTAPYLVALGAILFAVDKIFDAYEEEAEASKKSREQDELKRIGLIALANSYIALADATNRSLEIAKEQGATDLELLELQVKKNSGQLEFLRLAQQSAQQAANNAEQEALIQKKINDNLEENILLRLKIGNEIDRIALRALQAAQTQREIEAGAIKSLQSQFDAEYQIRLTEADRVLSLEKLNNELISKSTQDRIKNDLASEIAANQRKLESAKEFNKDTEALLLQIAVLKKRLKDQEKNEERNASDDQESAREQLFNDTIRLNENLLRFTQAINQRELQGLEEKKKQGLITEEQYQKEVSKIQSRAAAAEKQAAIFSALIGIANGIINALNSKTVPVPVAVGLASAIGALQLATIIATPLPRYKKGTLSLGRGNVDSDGGMHIIAHEGEAIIPKDRNREYHPTIRAVYNRQIKASDINAFVQSKLSGKMNHKVDAKINTKELARALSGSDSVTLKNGGLLAKQIGREIAGHYNPRRR